LSKNQFNMIRHIIIKGLIIELLAVFGGFSVPGSLLIFLSFFFFILFSNFIGLFPYVFTASRHLVFTLALSLPLWLGSIMWAVVYQFNRVMAHLVPLGTPGGLMPVIVIIESIRSVIRPFTLAIRLSANMIAGHLLLTLLGGQGRLRVGFLGVILALVLLLILECAVACIQSYVFTILRSLYLGELLRVSFSKKFI
jgi:F-type H+-transporting ATPase subunit a